MNIKDWFKNAFSNKGARYVLIVGALLALAKTTMVMIDDNTKDLKELKKEVPAVAIVYDSLGIVVNSLSEAQAFLKVENFEAASKELDHVDKIMDPKKINNRILDSLVVNQIITDERRDGIISLRKQANGLRKELNEKWITKRPGVK